MNKYILLFLIAFGQFVAAEVKLPAIVSSNMVLQRNTNVSIWGWANAYEEITIKTSWMDEVKILKADGEGHWRTEILTTNSKEPQTIHINQIKLDNVLFGEVWLCSGQSNIANSNNPNLRLFTVKRTGSKVPLDDLKEYTSWQQASPENVADFSAIGYFFAQQLQQILDVPVGIIHTSWGASIVEAWISQEVMRTYEEVTIDENAILNRANRTPTALFNAMINPLIPYTIKGALWYQGEGNRNDPEKYKKHFPAMVKDWRTRWGKGDFPFYFVQIAPYSYGDLTAFETFKNTAFMREAQLQCLDLIPNSGIAITIDSGSLQTIHPPKKKEVADRLLFNALNQTYGYKNVDFAAPTYESHIIEKNAILLSFKNANMGLYTLNNLEDFEIAGADRIFYSATAKIEDHKNIRVSSEEVLNPVAVRYAWKNWVEGTLYGINLLPVSSFRTDNWSDAKQSKK